MPKTPRTPKRYDPVLPSDIPPGTPVEQARRMVGKTDPAIKRRDRRVEVPPQYARRSSSLPVIAPPMRQHAPQQGQATADRPTMPRVRRHDTPEPPAPRRTVTANVPPVGPSMRPARQHAAPEAPSRERRATGGADIAPVSSSSPRRSAAPPHPVMPGGRKPVSGVTDLMPPSRERVSGGDMGLMPLAPPSFAESIDFGVPEMRVSESRGITGVSTPSSFVYGG